VTKRCCLFRPLLPENRQGDQVFRSLTVAARIVQVLRSLTLDAARKGQAVAARIGRAGRSLSVMHPVRQADPAASALISPANSAATVGIAELRFDYEFGRD